MTFSPRQSRPATPSYKSGGSYSYLYSPNHSRSKTSLPQPKVLPFPDLPVRPVSHESSRNPSPITSPVPTRHNSSNNVNIIIDASRLTNNNVSHTTSPVVINSPPSTVSIFPIDMARSSSSASQLASTTSPPPVHEHQEIPSGSINMESGPSRSRSSTTPSSSRPVPVPPVLNLNTPNRTRGFSPVPLATPIASSADLSSSPLPAAPRASSLPTSTPVRDASGPPVPIKKLSNPPPSPPPPATTTAIQITPVPSQKVLNDHMYQSFLKGTCADVCLYVRKWGVGWLLHKMVLVQAGFFHSMFLGGFSEMNGRLVSDEGKERALGEAVWHGEEIELIFDDPNITRAAFEICLSRLYSPYPNLHFPSVLLTTPECPLSPSFPPIVDLPDLQTTQLSLSDHAVLATPRLLLSIVATATYLGHANVMREALAMVLRTVGPGTVGRYLSFATGGGIGDEEWFGQSQEAARGLSEVAKPLSPGEHDDNSSSHDQSLSVSNDSSHSLSDDGSKVGNVRLGSVSETSTPTIRHLLDAGASLSRQPSAAPSLSELPHFYGFASNKLGEACACWLARWGVDVLDIELATPSLDARIWSHRGLPANFVAAVLSSDSFFVRDEMERYTVARKVLDLRRKGWEAEAESTGGSSIHGSLAESDGDRWEAWEADEEGLARVFANGIFYTHMTFDDLSSIAADIDPNTSLPYVPLSVLQAAHWAAADLRNKITSPNAADNQELGLAVTVAQLLPDNKRRRATPRSRQPSVSYSTTSLASTHDGPSSGVVYHPVPVGDDTHRIGAGGLPFLTALATATTSLPGLPGLPDLGPEVDSYSVEGARPSKFRPPPQGEKTAFGLMRGSRTVAELLDEHALASDNLSFGDAATQKWTKAEPYRFSVEFWGVHKLSEKERAYSATHFYAGSWFNVYVQTIRKKDKGTQLGIYLHRQNPHEAFPTPSAPSEGPVGRRAERSDDTLDRGDLLGAEGGLGLIGGTRMYRAMSTPPVTLRSQTNAREVPRGRAGNQNALHAARTREESDIAEAEEIGPYKDTRKASRAYFSISCASALGTALIRFSSQPDNFTVSQSWGWKSLALRSEEYLAGVPLSSDGEGLDNGVMGWTGEAAGTGREGSLRATVVVGVV